MADPAKYRTKEQLEQWQARDPIKTLGARLDSLGVASLRAKVEQAIEDEVADAVRFAEESPFPLIRPFWSQRNRSHTSHHLIRHRISRLSSQSDTLLLSMETSTEEHDE